jgi:hypothetical protein
MSRVCRTHICDFDHLSLRDVAEMQSLLDRFERPCRYRPKLSLDEEARLEALLARHISCPVDEIEDERA